MLRYAVTIFLGALLLFLVQPLIGKYILPWFGGGSSVWTVCLLFFQVALVAGYAYAYGLVRWVSPRGQAIIHVGLLCAAAALLPIIPADHWKPVEEASPTLRILALLAVTLGGPFLMLASTGPLMQAWFARSHADRSPYRLYALSNAGSLLGLLGYPILVEPMLTRHVQAVAWSCGFVAFALVAAWCAIAQAKSPVAATERASAADAARANSHLPWYVDRILWLVFPAVSTAMLLAVSSHITEDIAPIPLLWVLPLSAYLLSFIVCFEWPRLYVRGVWAAVLIGGMLLAAYLASSSQQPLILMALAQAAILTSSCMICHGELYRRRPDPSRLTSYYLAIAIGGAMGGAFVSLASPMLFATYAEYDLALHAAAALLIVSVLIDRHSALRRRSPAAAAWLVFIALWIVVIATNLNNWAARYRLSVENLRNFYGAMSLILVNREDPEVMSLRLMHGRITHGIQIADPRYRWWPTTYFGLNSAIGRILDVPPEEPRRVGVVGLGVGTLATYGRPGDVYRFYEINPQVIRVAKESFTYLTDSGAKIEIVPGDARLSMEREVPQKYDVIVLDAFTGDAIPLHLLTKEAFELYRRHLKPGGIIAVHISNRYLRLGRPIVSIARALGMHARIASSLGDSPKLTNGSRWALLSDNPAVFDAPGLQDIMFPDDQTIQLMEPWTDEFASVMSVLEWSGVPVTIPLTRSSATQPLTTQPETAPSSATTQSATSRIHGPLPPAAAPAR